MSIKKIIKYFISVLIFLSITSVIFVWNNPSISVLNTADGKILPIYRVQKDEKMVAISFDAAWGAEKTPELLQILKDRGIKTTFFVVQFWAEKYPDMAKRIIAEGHELGNHSATHPHLNSLSESQIRKEIVDTHNTIKEITGFEAKLFRPPFGEYSNKVIKVLESLGYFCIQWDVDSLDWKDLSAEAMAERVLKNIEPGSIVLFHNNGKHTPEGVKIILDNLLAQNYIIVPISELILTEKYYIDTRGEQRPLP
jgi:polysaccharide deacetylase family sporulation protein PdaB